MKISITRLELTNFKCFQHKEITFNPSVTTIRGRNGAGKTTIADAILWCLFGKDSLGRSDFSVKTHDAKGRDIPNLSHSVELCLLCDDSVVTLRRTLKETWVKKRGTDEQVLKNNTTEYFVNGDSLTAADYKKYIAGLVNEDVFRAITNPAYFPSLKWQQQRDFLTKMVAPPTPDEIAGTDNELFELASNEADVIAYRKHLSYQIKQVKDKLEKIPVRLEEQNKALPELLDWDKIKSEAAAAKVEHDRISDQIIKIKSGNGADVQRERIRNDIKVIQKSIDETEAEERRLYSIRKSEHDNKIAEDTRRFNSLVTTQRDLESQASSFETLAKRCRETAEDTFKKEQEYIRKHWPETQADFRSSDETRCPVCGQPLPPDMMEEKERLFNQNKATLKQQLTDRAAKAKQLKADAEREAKDYEQKKAEAEKTLADTKEQINQAFADKAKLEKEQIPSFESVLAANTSRQELLRQLSDLQQQLDSAGIDSDSEKQLSDLEAQKVQYTATLSQLNTQLATKAQYDRIQGLIADIEQEKSDLVSQLSGLEKKEDIARQYQDRENAILESRINEHFKIVRWRMFRTVNNGGDPFDEPFCECYAPDGSAYHDGANQAMRLNMGLDICNALCRHYNVSAPIIIDQSESTLNIIETLGQQIRLQVADVDLQVL